MKTIFKRFLFFVFLCVSSTLAIAQTYTFTNAGATGREGPTQSQIDSNYSGTNLEDKVTIITRGIQEWTVPESGTYRIEAWGAKGGSSDENRNGGLGAKLSGNFALNQNSVLKIVVGQEGIKINTNHGGGGGSFVVKSPYNTHNSVLITAGGGGGAEDLLVAMELMHLSEVVVLQDNLVVLEVQMEMEAMLKAEMVEQERDF